MSNSESRSEVSKAGQKDEEQASSLIATSAKVDSKMETSKRVTIFERTRYGRAGVSLNATRVFEPAALLAMTIFLLIFSQQLLINSAAQSSTQYVLKKEDLGVEVTTSSPIASQASSASGDAGTRATMTPSSASLILASSTGLGLEESRRMSDGSQHKPAKHNSTTDPDSDLRASAVGVAGAPTQAQDDMTANATLLIDYDQQGYYLPTSAASIVQGTSTSRLADGQTGAKSVTNTSQSSSSSSSESKSSIVGARRLEERERDREELRDVGFEPTATGDTKLDTSVTDDANRPRSASMRDSRDARLAPDKQLPEINATDIYKILFKKKPYSKFWTVEQKWDDIFKRFLAVEGSLRRLMLRSFLRDVEYYADIGISEPCTRDFRYVQEYARNSTNFRWLAHMLDATGKSEPGMLTGNLANLGHVIQCIRVRAPGRASNHTFSERFFAQQTQLLGERFRGKYCLASVRPVLPEKPRLVSRFSHLLDASLLSNISYMGEPIQMLRKRANDISEPKSAHQLVDRQRARLDQIPFESEMYQYLIEQRNFIYSLPRFLGVCYPSSCTRDDIQASIQKTLDEQHLVADIEFQCEQEEQENSWDWYSTPRLIGLVFAILVASLIASASLARYILVGKLNLRKSECPGKLANFIGLLDSLSSDKCIGILFVKTQRASALVDASKAENNRSSSIDALKGFLMLATIYSELVYLGCLPVPFMWSKWADSMFPFYRALVTQFFLNVTIWSEAFYTISAFVIALKFFQNHKQSRRATNLASFVLTRYLRLSSPVLAFMTLNYIWPRLSNGFVMQDQANKILAPCDQSGWTNMLLFHNYGPLKDTCLWPSHVSASFFQLHLLSYPILLLLLMSLSAQQSSPASSGPRSLRHFVLANAGIISLALLALFGAIYPALVAIDQQLIVPFLIDYIDIDNYRRVIESMVVPTYNHLTAYMAGIGVAYLVSRQANKAVTASLAGADSLESFKTYSSTNALESPDASEPEKHDSKSDSHSSQPSGAPLSPAMSFLINLIALLVLLLSTTASWYWNGLGLPMSSNQTFWYICTTKLTFSISFSLLFYRLFATRRNSSSPWMITRFLVPIGRLGLSLFYVSWIVIWFDLLSSLYQWHPSHYFVFEKFNEIIFAALVISMFVYGAFEGAIKLARLQQKNSKLSPLPVSNVDQEQQHQQRRASLNYSASKAFDTFYLPLDTMASKSSGTGKEADTSSEQQKAVSANSERSSICCDPASGASMQPAKLKNKLSISDQYKLNAELRANYSFASIGLYESAGATSDLQPHASDPQVSN